MTNKQVGMIGESKILSKFVSMGIPVSIPYGDNERYDLIAGFNGQLNRIQVKTSQKVGNGKYEFSIVSSRRNSNKETKHEYSSAEIDYFALYNIERDICLLLKVDECPGKQVSIRYEESKNNQSKNIRYEKDYTFENVID